VECVVFRISKIGDHPIQLVAGTHQAEQQDDPQKQPTYVLGWRPQRKLKSFRANIPVFVLQIEEARVRVHGQEQTNPYRRQRSGVAVQCAQSSQQNSIWKGAADTSSVEKYFGRSLILSEYRDSRKR